MKINFSIERLTPRFLYRDKNGYALCKAIERAFQMAAESAERGLSIIQNPDKMPEWRLDEMAWELNCLYDYTADEESKRFWIKNAIWLFTAYGTPQAVINYLGGNYQFVRVEEYWEYGGAPFHFKVILENPGVPGGAVEWAAKAIVETKNVRSILDCIEIRILDGEDTLHCGGTMSVMPRLHIPQIEDEYDFTTNERLGNTMSVMPRLPIRQMDDDVRFQETVRAGGTMRNVSKLAIPEIQTPAN